MLGGVQILEISSPIVLSMVGQLITILPIVKYHKNAQLQNFIAK